MAIEPEEANSNLLAQRAIEQMHASNGSRAIEAITQRNRLQILVSDTTNYIAALHKKIERALERGDGSEAQRWERETGKYEDYLACKSEQLAQAAREADTIKSDIRRQEERIRRKYGLPDRAADPHS